MIEVNNLSFEYKKGDPVLEAVSLTIKRGEMVTIVGQNGSGKTSLVKHFNGLLKPTRGDVYIDGVNTKETTIARLAKKVAYVFQNPNHQIFSNTVYNEIAFTLKRQKVADDLIKEKVMSVVAMLGIEHILEVHPMFINHAEKQMVAVASYLVTEPDVFIFDEPTSALDAFDSVTMSKIFEGLLRQGKTVIVITHDMNFVVEYASRVVVMDRARVVFDGQAATLFAEEDLFHNTALEMPQIKRLAMRLSMAIPDTVYDAKGLKDYFLEKGVF